MMDSSEHHRKSIRLSKVREMLGGCKALDSVMLEDGVNGLFDLGWSRRDVISAVLEEFASCE
jgi:hypothetical protein